MWAIAAAAEESQQFSQTTGENVFMDMKINRAKTGISALMHSNYMTVALATWCLKQTTECSMVELIAFFS